MSAGDKHQKLSRTAIGWLYGRGCNYFDNEVPTQNGIADALGVKCTLWDNSEGGTVYYIEAKASRSDLTCRKQKYTYAKADWCAEAIDFYYLIVADGVKVEDGLYPKWGVINEQGEVIRRAKRYKHNSSFDRLLNVICHNLVYKVFGKLYALEPVRVMHDSLYSDFEEIPMVVEVPLIQQKIDLTDGRKK